jgi:hypothetical protein
MIPSLAVLTANHKAKDYHANKQQHTAAQCQQN